MRHNKLMQLMIDNQSVAGRGPVAAVVSELEATMYIYDMIVSSELEAEYWGGVAPESFVKDLNEISAPTIHLRINSPGGDVFAARAIEAAIREHPSTIVAHVDGFAASAASYIAIACDQVEIASGGFFMVHNAWTFTAGNASELMKTAELLGKIDNSLVKTYASETKCDPDKIKKMMDEETWIDAEQAVELGFADKISDGEVSAKIAWNMSAYNKKPDEPRQEEIAPEVENVVDSVAAEEVAEENIRERYEYLSYLHTVTQPDNRAV